MVLKKEFKVGLLAIAAILIVYFGVDFLKGSDVFNPARKYYVVYSNVDGLTQSNPVMLNGFQVGLVRKIRLYAEHQGKVFVELEINKDVLVGDSAQAILANNGLLGGKMIVLNTGFIASPRKSDTLISVVAPGLGTLLEDKAEPIVHKLTHLIASVDHFVQAFEPTIGKLNNTLEAVESLSHTSDGLIKNSQTDIKGITANLQKLSSSLIDTEKEFQTLLKKMNQFGDSLNKAELAATIHSLKKTTEELNKTMVSLNEGKGTMGKLMKSDSLYRNLTTSSASLNALLVDFKANPKRYVHFSVFGKKEGKEKK